jgi:hypothetical protein
MSPRIDRSTPVRRTRPPGRKLNRVVLRLNAPTLCAHRLADVRTWLSARSWPALGLGMLVRSAAYGIQVSVSARGELLERLGVLKCCQPHAHGCCWGSLCRAFVDVDGLKAINDAQARVAHRHGAPGRAPSEHRQGRAHVEASRSSHQRPPAPGLGQPVRDRLRPAHDHVNPRVGREPLPRDRELTDHAR